MNSKEIGELRRRLRKDRSNMTAIFGCYVNDKGEIISEFRQSLGIMPENESEKYFALMRRVFSGTLGKNLTDLSFQTRQVADSPEHQLLMTLRDSQLNDEEARGAFFQKAIGSLHFPGSYLILLAYDSYDVPFRGKDGQTQDSENVYSYLLCAVCPVKQTKSALCYAPEDKQFHDGGVGQTVAPPELGFLFPAFDDRAANLYGLLYYTHSPKENYPDFAEAVFQIPVSKPAAEQKKSFEALLKDSLEEECSLDVVQAVHDRLCQQIELHKQSREAEPLLVDKGQLREALASCGVSEKSLGKFSAEYDAAFGMEAELHPKNIIDEKRVEIHTPDVAIRVSPDRGDLIQTRILGGEKYILISAQEDVEVNGVPIHIGTQETAKV